MHCSLPFYMGDRASEDVGIEGILERAHRYEEVTVVKFWRSQKVYTEFHLHGDRCLHPGVIQGLAV